MSEARLKKLPALLTDEAAERFIDTADLSEYDLSGFRPMRSIEFSNRRAGLCVSRRSPGSQFDCFC